MPFQIGMQYENWEFDLEPIDTETSYDKYRYFKDDIIDLFDLEGISIYLYFYMDILFKVEVIFDSRYSEDEFIRLGEKLELKFGNMGNNYEDKTKVIKIWKDSRKCLIIEHNFKSKIISLILVGKEYLNV